MKRGKTGQGSERVPGLRVSRKALRTLEPPISELMARAIQTPGRISFGAGLVDDGGDHVPQNHLRLCFGHVPMRKIEQGIARLGRKR